MSSGEAVEIRFDGFPLEDDRRHPDQALQRSWDGDLLRFPYDPNVSLSLHFPGLAGPDRRLHYRLEGFDPRTVVLDPGESTVRFRGLPSGHYRLVLEVTGDSRVPEASARRFLHIEVVEPFWRAPGLLWAYGALAAWVLYRSVLWVTARRRRTADLGRELRQMESRKLESLSTLAGGVAHDFNNLLVGIFGYAELARLEVEPGSTLAGYLDRIEESADRAAELSRQMLFYSGRGTFTVKPLSLSELVRETVQELKPAMGAHVSILLELERHIPAIEGDEPQLKQMVRNLVTNAAEALGKKPGIVVLSTGFMVVGGGSDLGKAGKREHVFLTVDDTGRGIEPEDVGRIFDPFFSTKSPGRGLGLAVTQGIVRGHGATLKVSSTPGRGTTFRVLFPSVGRLKPATPEKGPAMEVPRDRGKVLVVDDEPTVRSVARRFLDRLGFESLEAESGERGIEMYREAGEEIEWVLLDISMPGIDGIETARRLRELDPSVVIVMSSGFSQEEAFQGLENPAQGFIEKPYRLADLERALRSLGNLRPEAGAGDRSAAKAPRR